MGGECMDRSYLDVTDLIEFLTRSESPSGVQRVVAEVAPLLMASIGARSVLLDRSRGAFVELDPGESHELLTHGVRSCSHCDPVQLAALAEATIQRARTAQPALIDTSCTLVFLGALWINDALMSAARLAQSRGATLVALLYDLTPVMEAGHTAAVNHLFERYLDLLMNSASAVPSISESSRRDFGNYAKRHGQSAPPGHATGLPCGLTPENRDLTRQPWPRRYVLFVGTIESRKNHRLALEAWRRLLERHDPEVVPDLVCIGRLGWHTSEFLDEYIATSGLGGKVSVLSNSVSDEELAEFYSHAEFTLYPSRYEGWGLPVGESIAFGKVPVVADNSSLREVGGDAAIYVATDDLDALVSAVDSMLSDPKFRNERQQAVNTNAPAATTWEDVASVIAADIQSAERRDPMFPEVDLGREYMLVVESSRPDAGYADQYLAHAASEGVTPMLGQPRGDRDFTVSDAAIVGTFGSPQTWGWELRPGGYADIRLTRPVDGPLTVLVSTRSMPGRASIEIAGPGGPSFHEVYLGSVISVQMGDGSKGTPAQARISVTDAADSIEGFMGLRSFVVLRGDDKDAHIIALDAANKALRQELDFIQGTRSWKVTAPLRRWKGRGA
ncbi:glycosyltransferase family 4 protein [bacterium]|nr:glycosyltransferase family 4 protein [bacterium]